MTNTTGGVATSIHFAAFGIVDPHKDIGFFILWRFHDDQLVTANALLAICNPAHLIIGECEHTFSRVNDHEIIAQTIHFQIRNRVAAHLNAYIFITWLPYMAHLRVNYHPYHIKFDGQ